MTAIRKVQRTFSYREGVTKVGLMKSFADALDTIEQECHDEGVYPAWNYLEIESHREGDEGRTYKGDVVVNEWTEVILTVPAVRLVTVKVVAE